MGAPGSARRASVAHMIIDNSELERITCTQLNIGNAASISMGGVSVKATTAVGQINLVGVTGEMNFTGGTFEKGIVLGARGGINVIGNLTTSRSMTTLNAGDGVLSVIDGTLIQTTNQPLTLIAHDVRIPGLGLSTGNSTIRLSAFPVSISTVRTRAGSFRSGWNLEGLCGSRSSTGSQAKY